MPALSCTELLLLVVVVPSCAGAVYASFRLVPANGIPIGLDGHWWSDDRKSGKFPRPIKPGNLVIIAGGGLRS